MFALSSKITAPRAFTARAPVAAHRRGVVVKVRIARSLSTRRVARCARASRDARARVDRATRARDADDVNTLEIERARDGARRANAKD